ncbi:MAG: hypothetical protein CW694_04950 [Candidatus Syntrophoarchaeum sp. WYZ-LMO15]|nr:MAG: hypothetical protein CW694_04950 [Candidatus Syntrophoarchaeum sp. WYZ-LMO15]
MIILRGTIRAISPIHIGTVGTGNYHPTLPYIPARTIRGMLGNYLFNEKRDLFEKLRIDDDENPSIHFKPALPEGSVASPLILRWCKRCGKLIEELDKDCPECLQEGKKRGGLMLEESLSSKKFRSPEIRSSIDTKCPITRRGHTSPGERYSLSPYNIGALLPGSEFDLRCVLPGKYVDEVKDAFREAGIFYGIGGFRSKGYGMVEFDFTGEEGIDGYIERRSSEFDGSSLLMVLNSPAIFEEDSGYTIGLKERLLEEELGKVRVIKQVFSEDRARGWEIKGGYRLGKIIPATGMGSSAIVRIDPERAARAEVYGIGSMRHIYGDVYFRRWDYGAI